MKKILLSVGLVGALIAGNLLPPFFTKDVAKADAPNYSIPQFIGSEIPFNVFQDPSKPDFPKIIVDKRTKVQYILTSSGSVTLIVDPTGKPLLYTEKLY